MQLETADLDAMFLPMEGVEMNTEVRATRTMMLTIMQLNALIEDLGNVNGIDVKLDKLLAMDLVEKCDTAKAAMSRLLWKNVMC